MCGIAGILTDSPSAPASFEELRRMVAMLRHRGPDEYGLYRDDHIGLAHARLSIIDLAGGAQPIHNEDQSIWIAFNGEVFNYLELREELESAGHRFATRTDTEVIVHCYEQYGEQTWEKLNGQFAFALWDRPARRLWLVRDRSGILPLYYARSGGTLVFASEAKALFAGGRVTPRFDATGLVQVFSRWSPTAPRTVFEGIESVPPATAIRIDEHLKTTQTIYWHADLSLDDQWKDKSLDQTAEALGERLSRSVSLRLRADVPVGAYLSGGLDSSVIAHLIRSADSSPLQTFAVRFEDPAFDETPQQRRMAELLGTQHHEILCGPEEIREALSEVIWHTETPLLRTAPVPLFLLSKLVSENGMKVVLTGEGADELFAGYHIFREDKIRRFWARQPDSTSRPELLASLYPYVGGGRGQRTRLWQQFFSRGLTETDDPFYSHKIRWLNTSWAVRFLATGLRESFDEDRLEAELMNGMPPGWLEWRPLARAQMIERVTFLSSYLLSCQGDRVAMGHGVEVRYPFLDPDVIDLADGMPSRSKLIGLNDKACLRRFASRRLPEEIWKRPKQPYRAPTTSVLFGRNAPEYVRELLSQRSLMRFGLADPTTAAKLVEKAHKKEGHMSGEREEMALVGLVSLQLLAHMYLDEFKSRADAARHRLDTCEPRVYRDLSSRPTDAARDQAASGTT